MECEYPTTVHSLHPWLSPRLNLYNLIFHKCICRSMYQWPIKVFFKHDCKGQCAHFTLCRLCTPWKCYVWQCHTIWSGNLTGGDFSQVIQKVSEPSWNLNVVKCIVWEILSNGSMLHEVVIRCWILELHVELSSLNMCREYCDSSKSEILRLKWNKQGPLPH